MPGRTPEFLGDSSKTTAGAEGPSFEGHEPDMTTHSAPTAPKSASKRSIPTLLAESDYHLSHLSRLLSTARSRSPLATHTALSSRKPPPPTTPEAERDLLRAKNDQLATALNRVKKERNASIAAEMEAVKNLKELERENQDLSSVIGLLEKEVDRLSLGVLVVGTTPGKSPLRKGRTPTSEEKKGVKGGDGEVIRMREGEGQETPTKGPKVFASALQRGEQAEETDAVQGSDEEQAGQGSEGAVGAGSDQLDKVGVPLISLAEQREEEPPSDVHEEKEA